MKIWSIFVAFLENMNCTNEYVMKNAVFKKIRILDPFYCALFYSFHTFFCAAFNCLVKKVLTTSQVKRLSWLSVPLRLFSTQKPRWEGANRKKSWKTFLSNRRCSLRTTMWKVEMWKDMYSFGIVKVFDIWCGFVFAIWMGQIQSKLIFRFVTYEPTSL